MEKSNPLRPVDTVIGLYKETRFPAIFMKTNKKSFIPLIVVSILMLFITLIVDLLTTHKTMLIKLSISICYIVGMAMFIYFLIKAYNKPGRNLGIKSKESSMVQLYYFKKKMDTLGLSSSDVRYVINTLKTLHGVEKSKNVFDSDDQLLKLLTALVANFVFGVLFKYLNFPIITTIFVTLSFLSMLFLIGYLFVKAFIEVNYEELISLLEGYLLYLEKKQKLNGNHPE